MNKFQRKFEKSSVCKYFSKILEDNFAEILRKFFRHFEIIFQKLLRKFSEISEKFQIFRKYGNFELFKEKNSKICEKTLHNEKEDLGKILKTFWITEKFSVNL